MVICLYELSITPESQSAQWEGSDYLFLVQSRQGRPGITRVSLPPCPCAPLSLWSLPGVLMGKVKTRRAFHSPSGSTRGPGPPPPAQRGRSPATGRNTRRKERRQSRGRVRPGQPAGPSGPLTNTSPEQWGPPSLTASSGHTHLSWLPAWSSPLNPSCTDLLPVLVKYLPCARYGRVRQLLPSIIGGGDR